MGGQIVREFGMVKYTLLYLKWITNKNLRYSTENSAQCLAAACMERDFEGEWIRVCVWLSPFCYSPETIALLINYTPKQNKKFIKKIIML